MYKYRGSVHQTFLARGTFSLKSQFQLRQVTGRIAELLADSRSVANEAQSLDTDVAAALVEIRRLRDEARNGTELLKEVLKRADNSRATATSIGKMTGSF